MKELICHLIGDYLLQSDWMASEKVKRFHVALTHGLFYSLPFLFLSPTKTQILIIAVSHAVIDRWRIAKYVVYFKNFISPVSYWYKWDECSITGYNKSRPDWLAVWLMIIADNTLHLVINHFTLAWVKG